MCEVRIRRRNLSGKPTVTTVHINEPYDHLFHEDTVIIGGNIYHITGRSCDKDGVLFDADNIDSKYWP